MASATNDAQKAARSATRPAGRKPKTAKGSAARRPAAETTRPARRKAPAPAAKKAPKATAKSVPSPSAPDLEIDPDVLEFIAAIDAYKRAHDKPFPSWSEILWILRQLGYRRA
jgi:hypothetical protein